MSKVIKLKRGLDIRLVGEAEKTVVQMPVGSTYAVVPDSFPRITPKLLVSEGARVKAGTPLFFDKARPQILFTSPVSGTVSAVRRGGSPSSKAAITGVFWRASVPASRS